MSALAGRACALWILPASVRHPWGTTVPEPDAAATVAGIDRALRGTEIHPVDWADVADRRPDWHIVDGIHHTAAGRQAYGAVIATAVRDRCSGPAGPRTAGERFVARAHARFLHRPATVQELRRWGARLANGVPAGVLAGELARRPEWIGTEIDDLYRRALGRTADRAGRDYWSGLVASGMRLTDVGAAFYGSPEFLQRSGSTNEGFVANLYRQVLHREAEPGGLAHWTATVDHGLRRQQVAASFYDSVESRRDRVDRLYRALLDHAPDPGGMRYWADRLRDADDVQVAAALGSTDEFFGLGARP